MLKNKSILVVGGGGLLGSCLISKILSEGAQVIAIDINLENMRQKLNLLNVPLDSKKLTLASIDITNENEVKKFFKNIDDIDGAVNCSYPKNSNYGTSFFEVSLSDFNENVSLHLGSAFLIMRECASYYIRNKRDFALVNIASIYGSNAPDFSIYHGTDMTMPVEYAAIKSAIIHLNKYVASFMSDSSFRINSVSPGGLLANQPKRFLDSYQKKAFGKRMLLPQDILGTIIFLLSNSSQFINGQDIIVDNGFTL